MSMKRLLLSFYPPTAKRLSNAQFPVNMTLTKWINEAICQRLDREQPQTIFGPGGLSAAPPQEAEETKVIDPYAYLAEEKRKAGRNVVGAYCLYNMGNASYTNAQRKHKLLGINSPGIESLLESQAINDGEGILSEDQKRAIMAEHAERLKPAPVDPDAIPDDVKGHKIKYNQWREERDGMQANTLTVAELEARALADGRPPEVHTAEFLALCKPAAKPAEPDGFWE